jgi:two-component system, NtrC family, sensor kinase
MIRFIKNLKNFSQVSITRKTLFNMTARIALVMCLSTGVSYWHVMSNLEKQTKDQLEKYIAERGQRESSILQLAKDNLTLLRKKILQDVEEMGNTDLKVEFDRLTLKWSDGSYHNFPENRPKKDFDNTKYAGIFINKSTKINSENQRLLVASYNRINNFGQAWSNRFLNTYLNTPDNIMVIYWLGVSLTLDFKPDYDNLSEEFVYIADPKHNPQKQLTWTGLYYDKTAKDWMVSAILPIYNSQEKFLGSIGHDIILNQLIEQTINDKLKGTYNIIFQNDGRLIIHPYFIDKIKETGGKYNISDAKNPHLQEIYTLTKKLDGKTAVIENSKYGEYLAVTKLADTNWYFVTVYPKSLLYGKAFETVYFVLISGAIALFIEILLLYSVLRQQIQKPLKQLITATKEVTTGNFDTHLDVSRKDELGQLATAFNSMTEKLQESFTTLEERVSDRTSKLEENNLHLQATLQELKQTQTNLIQAEKMSALGQMVAGVAHEINNPVNFIHGNLVYVDEHTQSILKLVTKYQQYYPNPPAELQEIIDETELSFIEEDLEKILHSMEVGTVRIREIVLSLRNFSRLDESDFKAADIHQGIDNTLMILQHRLKAQSNKPEIKIIKKYGDIPEIECYIGQLNQVFMNLLGNAIDALEEEINSNKFESKLDNVQKIPTISIQTHLLNNYISIVITDNGIGIPVEISQKLFDPFFTTKSVGKGTGLGLSISYQIIVEKHRGKIWCDSIPGKETKFVIEIPLINLS